MNYKTINALIKETRAVNAKRGFMHSSEFAAINQVSIEIFKAVEAANDECYADLNGFHIKNQKLTDLATNENGYMEVSHTEIYQTAFRDKLKNTFEDKIASAAIAVLSYMDFKGFEFSETNPIEKSNVVYSGDLNEDAFKLQREIAEWLAFVPKGKCNKPFNLKMAFRSILAFSKHYNFSLENHMRLKLAYTSSRYF
jgi:hypothetical protein